MEIKEGDIFSNGWKEVIIERSKGIHKFEPPEGELFAYRWDGTPFANIPYLLNPKKHFVKLKESNE